MDPRLLCLICLAAWLVPAICGVIAFGAAAMSAKGSQEREL